MRYSAVECLVFSWMVCNVGSGKLLSVFFVSVSESAMFLIKVRSVVDFSTRMKKLCFCAMKIFLWEEWFCWAWRCHCSCRKCRV